jgi:hypothetical protein
MSNNALSMLRKVLYAVLFVCGVTAPWLLFLALAIMAHA